MENEIKIGVVAQDVLVLKFNGFIKPDVKDQISKEIREQYKTGLIFVPAYMDVYVVKSNSYIAKQED